jgi:23S rRNA (pseudouridine1915-N3)-methyltransferase
MKLTLLLTGKTEGSWLKTGIELYEERLVHYVGYQRIEIPELKLVSKLTQHQIKEKEGELILKYIKPSDEVILLDEKGDEFSSEKLAAHLEKKSIYSAKSIIFVIGGAYGFSDALYKRSNEKISLSKMTFSHQMVRLIFLEQLYRVFTIVKGEPYHHK